VRIGQKRAKHRAKNQPKVAFPILGTATEQRVALKEEGIDSEHAVS
jgi:hypothetical protein